MTKEVVYKAFRAYSIGYVNFDFKVRFLRIEKDLSKAK